MWHVNEGLSQSLLTTPQVTFKAQPCGPCGVDEMGMRDGLRAPLTMLLSKKALLSVQYLFLFILNRGHFPTDF